MTVSCPPHRFVVESFPVEGRWDERYYPGRCRTCGEERRFPIEPRELPAKERGKPRIFPRRSGMWAE